MIRINIELLQYVAYLETYFHIRIYVPLSFHFSFVHYLT